MSVKQRIKNRKPLKTLCYRRDGRDDHEILNQKDFAYSGNSECVIGRNIDTLTQLYRRKGKRNRIPNDGIWKKSYQYNDLKLFSHLDL